MHLQPVYPIFSQLGVASDVISSAVVEEACMVIIRETLLNTKDVHHKFVMDEDEQTTTTSGADYINWKRHQTVLWRRKIISFTNIEFRLGK